MVIHTVHSSGVGRMHGGMKTARPLQTSRGPEAKLTLTPGMVAKKDGAVELDSSSRPGLVIRRRIMARQSEEADEAAASRFDGVTLALSNQPNAATTTSVILSHEKTDHSSQQCDVISSSTTITITQDQCTAMTKPLKKTLRLFDLNKLPTAQESVLSPASSPTSTIDSADSTTHHDLAMATRSSVDANVVFSTSSPSMKRFRDEGRVLAVDLGLPTPLVSRRNIEAKVEDQRFAFRKPQPWEVEYIVLPTPTRKRLRKLSEYAGGRTSSTSMAKSWTTSDGDGCNHRDDVTKTLGVSQADAKVRCLDVVDDEVFGAVAALLALSSSTHIRRRDVPFSSNGEASSSGDIAFADNHMDEGARRETGNSTDIGSSSSDLAASDNDDPSRSLGSGSSVLLRPRNKQRYRSMAEIMAQTPILHRRRAA